MTNAWFIIMYDISNAQRLQKVHRFLKPRAYALQKSVFAWRGNISQLNELQQQLQKLINTKEDDVRGYRVPANQNIELWGVNPFCAGIFDARYPPVQHREQAFNIPVSANTHATQACLTVTAKLSSVSAEELA